MLLARGAFLVLLSGRQKNKENPEQETGDKEENFYLFSKQKSPVARAFNSQNYFLVTEDFVLFEEAGDFCFGSFGGIRCMCNVYHLAVVCLRLIIQRIV